jgi:RimJ/RimL family protein N-acetyltransferase
MSGIKFRTTREEDLDFVVEAEQAEANRDFVGQWSREQHRALFTNPDSAHMLFEMVAEGKPVGFAIVNGLQNPHQSVELMRIVVTDKGRGYGREAIRLIKRMAFEDTGAHRLWLDVKSHNQRACHVYEAEGFITEGTLRECLKAGEGYESLVVMSILRGEYQG